MTTPNTPSIDLTGRDAALLTYVYKFKQLASTHIHQLLFNTSSKTPTDRTLTRLVNGGYLARVERRMVGGARGGSGQYVYQLGRRGHGIYHGGRYSPARTVSYHSMLLADCFVVLKQLERSGFISVAAYSTEPDCWQLIGRNELRPDLFVEVERQGGRLKLWLEADMATEGQRHIKEKLERYWRAYNEADVAVWPEFPRVLFVAVDQERAKELEWLIGQGPKEALPLFAATTREGLSALLSGG